MPQTTGRKHCVFGSSSSVRPSNRCPLRPISRETKSLYLVGLEWNSAEIIIGWLGTAEKVSNVRGQKSRSWPDELSYNDGRMHFDDVASKLTIRYYKENLTIHMGTPPLPSHHLPSLPSFSSFTLSSLPLPLLLFHSLYSSLFLRSRSPLFQLGSVGSEKCSSVRSGAEPKPKSILVHFSLTIWHLVATVLMIFMRITCLNFIPS